MKRAVWSVADCIISPLGVTSEENYARIRKGLSGVSGINDAALSHGTFYASAIGELPSSSGSTRFETLCEKALRGVLAGLPLPRKDTLLILSTTKGNIDRLDSGEKDHPRIHLHATADYLSGLFGFGKSLVVSNACISGVLALQIAKRFIEAGQYHHAVVVGADVLSHFVVSGFQSLQALSAGPCKPFDKARTGINLGEAAAAMVLSSKPEELGVKPSVRLAGEGSSNDANHISGPSRTGEELAFAIRRSLESAGLAERDIDFISAHGTATLYNDEMEANAFAHARLDDVPLNSLKGYFGHTLGAAGVVETIISIHSLLNGELIPAKGFDTPGTSRPVNVCRTLEPRVMSTILKTASGFGGCNAALILQRDN